MALSYILPGADNALILGLSTDAKPVIPVDNAAFFEMDTGRVYFILNGVWAETGSAVAVNSDGSILSSGGGIGYTAGAGGTVTQQGSRTTDVMLNKLCGTIVMVSALVLAATMSTFVLTNSFIEATDLVLVRYAGLLNPGAWQIDSIAAAGSCRISVKNISAVMITEATPLTFMVLKGAIL